MRKILLSLVALALFTKVNAQTIYDFGTTGQAAIAPVFSSGSTAPQWPLVNASPYVPLPANATGGIVSRGSVTGNVQLVNTPTGSLTGAYLKFTGGATGVTSEIPSKFGIYNNTTATNLATVKFKMHFPAGTVAGSYLFCFGNGGASGNTANAASGVSTGQNLVVLRFAAGASAITINHYSSGAYQGGDFIGGANTITKDVTHQFTLFMNNSATDKAYEFNGTNTLTAGTYDVYVDGVKVLAAATTSGLASGTGASNSLDDMNIMNSVLGGDAANPSVMYFDDFVYSNALTPSVLPVKFSQISAAKSGTGINVNWTTASEANNDYFEIEASTDGQVFKTVKSVTTKNGNSSAIQNYQEIVELKDVAGLLAIPLVLGFIGFGPISRRRKAMMMLLAAGVLLINFVGCQKEAGELLSPDQINKNDIVAGKKTIYIRVKQVDKNGEFSNSEIVVAK